MALVITVLLLLAGSYCSAEEKIPAFPGAEGFGASSIGGRGGKVYEVTNLNDRGPGSFREACEARGPRTVVFRVSGTIELKAPGIKVSRPFLSVAGETAPGDGICLKRAAGEDMEYLFRVFTNDVIIRFIRFRPGPGGSIDGLSIQNHTRNLMVDHCSLSWAVDENVGAYKDFGNVTIQWCIISEALTHSGHQKGKHGMGLLMGSDGSGDVTLHHNLFAHNNQRNPRIKLQGMLDCVNNVIYDYGEIAGHFTDDYSLLRVNYVGNFVKPGPSSYPDAYSIKVDPTKRENGFSLFLDGNIGPQRKTNDMPQDLIVAPEYRKFMTARRHEAPPVTATTASEAYERVLQSAGAALPRRDRVDRRIVKDVRNGTGGLIDDPSEFGGWPELRSEMPPADDDHDGLPNRWEEKNGLDPNDLSDGAKDTDGDGYTNLEEYLHSLARALSEIP